MKCIFVYIIYIIYIANDIPFFLAMYLTLTAI